ncbi:hypothetical protein CWS43_08490 [Rahnella sp. AA]|uniref:hypothetical protein n=1 Tax=Rahnella sp. AA TaxID=2057180 RepID=UPI000C33F7F0|nr:hypothetical protein [Rahnella sp. AA]PKE30723.1 hypothetical protein CWS43_08490 [Rahnella sp. AA]
MTDTDDIADRIAEIILSPETITGLVHGALTVPLDFGYLVYGVFDTDSHYKHETTRIRMADAIKNDILNYENITNAVSMVFNTFNEYLSESAQDKVYRNVIASIIGRMGTNTIISITTAAVLERVSFITATFKSRPIAALTGVLLIGGMMERSIRTSERLEQQSPDIYKMLRQRNYDLLYFLFEASAQPFVDAIQVRVTQGAPAFRKIMEKLRGKLNA